MRLTKFRRHQDGRTGAGLLGSVALALLLALSVSAQTAPARFYPKNLASPLLGTRIRVDASSGFHLANGYPVPVTPGGVADVSSLLTDDFDGLEFAPGVHSLTITLATPQIVDRIAFLNRTGEGTFTAAISGSDPQLLGPSSSSPAATETKLAGPDMANAAVFQPQTAQYIHLEFKISKRGRLGHFAVYGRASELDYTLDQRAPSPASPSALAAPMSIEVDVAAPSAGGRIVRVSSQKAGSDPAWLIADSLDTLFFFHAAEKEPSFDIDFHAPRRANRAAVLLSGPPSRIDLIRLPAWTPPSPAASADGIVTRSVGTVEIIGLSESDHEQVKPGTQIKPGQFLRTGFDSMVEMEIGGKSLVRLGASSNAFVRSGAAGVELNLLRGQAIWQVYDPTGGGSLVTPTTISDLSLGTLAAEVKLTGESRIYLLETDSPTGVQVRSRAIDERYSLNPDEDVNLSPGASSGFAVEPFVARTYWSQSPIGSAVGGLRGSAEKKFDAAQPPHLPEEILATATTPEGLSQALFTFKEQALDGVRFRITPLSSPAPSPIVIVKAEVFGTYKADELEVTRKGSAVPPTPPAPAPTPAPAPAAPGTDTVPALPVPAPGVTVTPLSDMSSAPATPSTPQVVSLKDDSAAAPPPPSRFAPAPLSMGAKKAEAVVPALVPVPVAPVAPQPVAPSVAAPTTTPAPAAPQTPTSTSATPTDSNIFNRQNSKRASTTPTSSAGVGAPPQPLIPPQ